MLIDTITFLIIFRFLQFLRMKFNTLKLNWMQISKKGMVLYMKIIDFGDNVVNISSSGSVLSIEDSLFLALQLKINKTYKNSKFSNIDHNIIDLV